MRTRTNILLLLSMLLLSVTISSKVYPQEPLPPEKKRALSKFDPAEVFPQSNDRTKENGRKKSPAADSASTKNPAQANTSSESASQRKAGRKRSSTATPSDGVQASINPMPSAVLSAAERVPAPTPSATPLPITTPLPIVTPPLPTPTSAAAPTAESQPTPQVAAVNESSDPPAAPPLSTTNSNPGVSGTGLLLPVIILSLVLFALVVVIIKLKKQLSAS
jgi:hypothetical protein